MVSPANEPKPSQLTTGLEANTPLSHKAIGEIVDKFRAKQHQFHSAETSLEKLTIKMIPGNHDKAKTFRGKMMKLLIPNDQKILINIPGQGLIYISRLLKVFEMVSLPEDEFWKFYHSIDDWDSFGKDYKFPPICRYTLEGNVEQLKEEIDKSQVNAVDADGKSALMWAAIFGLDDMVDILVKAGADINQLDDYDKERSDYKKEIYGRSAFDFVIINNNLELVKLFLLLGAIPSLSEAVLHKDAIVLKFLLAQGIVVPDPNEHLMDPISTSIRFGMKENFKLLVEAYNSQQLTKGHSFRKAHGELLSCIEKVRGRTMSIAKKFYLENSPGREVASEYARTYRLTKVTSHALELAGEVRIQDHKVKLEGFLTQANCPVMAQTWKEYASNYLQNEPTYTLDSIRHLRQALHFASDQKSRKPYQLLMRINRGMPVIINVGHIGHAGSFLIWNGFIVHCDRGGEIAWDKNLTIYTYDPKKMNADIIKHIVTTEERSSVKYHETVEKFLPEEIDLQEVVILQIPSQKVGNCTWASLEGTIKGFLYLSEEFSAASTSMDGKKEKVDRLFNGWQTYQRLQALDQYLDVEYDPLVVRDALASLNKSDSVALLVQKDTADKVLKKFAEREIYRLEDLCKEGQILVTDAAFKGLSPAYFTCEQICSYLNQLNFDNMLMLQERLENNVLAKLSLNARRTLMVEKIFISCIPMPLAFVSDHLPLSVTTKIIKGMFYLGFNQETVRCICNPPNLSNLITLS